MAGNLKQTIEFQAKGIRKLKKQYKELENRTKGLEGSTAKAGGGLKSLGKTAAVAGAAFFGARAIIGGLQQSIQLASKFQGVSRGFDNLAKSAGFSSDAFSKFQDATDGTIGSIELMTQANNAMLLGITDSEDQMAEMFDVAQRLAQGLGKDTAFGIESLVTGLGRQSKLMLDNLGIMIDVDKANKDFAKSLNKSTSELTDQERKQAFVNTAMEEGRKLVEKMGEEQLTMASSMDQAKSAASDVGIELGQSLSPAVTKIASGFAGAATAVANYIKSLRLSTAEITEATTAEEKEDILLAKIATKKQTLIDIGWQLGAGGRQKMENELLQLQVELVEAINKRKDKELEASLKKLDITMKQIEAEQKLIEEENKKGKSLDLGGEDFEAFIRQQQELADAKAVEAEWNDIIKEQYPLLAESMGLLGDQMELTAQDRAAIQTEFNERYIQSVKGTYLLESKEITDAMARYSKVEKDKTKLTEMETALRTELQLKTGQSAAAHFASTMQKMADSGMVGMETAKDFAKIQAMVDSYAAANAAYKAMAGIPVVGPALAIAAAAAAIGAGFANVRAIESAETGFEGIVDRPTMFMTGEGNKREHIAVTPLENPNINGPKGGSNITINVSSPLMDESVVETIIPAIKRAVRLDLA